MLQHDLTGRCDLPRFHTCYFDLELRHPILQFKIIFFQNSKKNLKNNSWICNTALFSAILLDCCVHKINVVSAISRLVRASKFCIHTDTHAQLHTHAHTHTHTYILYNSFSTVRLTINSWMEELAVDLNKMQNDTELKQYIIRKL